MSYADTVVTREWHTDPIRTCVMTDDNRVVCVADVSVCEWLVASHNRWIDETIEQLVDGTR